MATLLSSSSLIFSSKLPSNSSPSLTPTLSLSSLSQSYSFSSSLSISPSFLTSPTSTKRLSFSTLNVKAQKKKVLIVNTNSGGHAVIGFYFAKQLLGSGHEVTIMTVGEENSDKMKKPPFSRFSVEILFFYFLAFWLCLNLGVVGFCVCCVFDMFMLGIFLGIPKFSRKSQVLGARLCGETLQKLGRLWRGRHLMLFWITMARTLTL